MSKIEMIIFAVLAVTSAVTAFDFIAFVLKSAPKTAYFAKTTWMTGLLATIALVYWYMNGMKFH